MKTALVLAAHGDDETSMAGTIRKLVLNKWKVHLIVGTLEIGNINRTSEELEQALKLLGVSGYDLLDFRSWVRDDRTLISVLDQKIENIKPDVIFSHWLGDTHLEHQLLTKAAMTAIRRTGISLLMYKEPNTGGPSSEAFRPDILIDITETYDLKIRTLEAYKSQISRYKFWRQATEGAAKYYGSMMMVPYAEAFQVVKFIWNEDWKI